MSAEAFSPHIALIHERLVHPIQGDPALAHPTAPDLVSIGRVFDAPDKVGVYSMRLLTGDEHRDSRAQDIKVLLEMCMDKRFADPVYRYLLEQSGYSATEIAVLSYAGGPAQVADRLVHKSMMVDYAVRAFPQLTTLARVVHGGRCAHIATRVTEGASLQDVMQRELNVTDEGLEEEGMCHFAEHASSVTRRFIPDTVTVQTYFADVKNGGVEVHPVHQVMDPRIIELMRRLEN